MSEIPRVLGTRLSMTSGTEYGGTPVVVTRWRPMVVLKGISAFEPLMVPRAAVVPLGDLPVEWPEREDDR